MPQGFTHWAAACKSLFLTLGLLAAALPAAAQTAYALALIGSRPASFSPALIIFDVATPGTPAATVPITGLGAGQLLAGLDVRPSTGQLYALGYDGSQAQLYLLSPTTGVVTAVGAAQPMNLGGNTARIGFDFNPTTDRIRVTSGVRTNYRLNPNDGTLAATDGTLTYASTDPNAGQTPDICASAHTNSYFGSTATTLYNLTATGHRLVIQNSPDSGILTTVATLGGGAGIPPTGNASLDIYYNPLTDTNVAYFCASLILGPDDALNGLFTLNLTTGVATPVGSIGSSAVLTYVTKIAVAAPTSVGTGTRAPELASDLALYPNPLAGSTQVSFGLPRAAHVELTVTDALGRTIDHLDAGQLPAGPQALRWQRRNQAAGAYFFRLCFDGQPAGTRQAMLTE